MEIMANRLDRGFYLYQNEFEEKALEVLRSGWYVLGKELQSFEKEFKNAISPYVKSENVYFVEGQPQEKNGLSSHIPYLLEKLGGGIHCLCAEIPKDTLEEQSCGQL